MEGIHLSLRSVGTYNNENEENKNKIIIPTNIILSQSRNVQVSDTRIFSSAYISIGITSIVCAYTQEGPLIFRKNNIYFFESLFTVSFYQLFFFFCSRPMKSPLQTSVNTWQTTGVTRARI